MINVVETRNRLIVSENDNQLLVNKPQVVLVAVAQQGLQGPPGPQGPAGGLTAVEDDFNPTLGGNLNLNGFQIIGQIDDTGFIIDGGLV